MTQLNEKVQKMLEEFFKGNEKHVQKYSDRLKKHEDGQDPEFVVVSCSDSRVLHEKLSDLGQLGRDFTDGEVGSLTAELSYKGNIVPSGNIDYVPETSDTPTGIIIVGHTNCGAVKATLDFMDSVLENSEDIETPSQILEKLDHEEQGFEKHMKKTEGIATKIYLMLETGIAEDYEQLLKSEKEYSHDQIWNILVERNVDNQVRFLLENTDYPEDVAIFGAVYDMTGFYGENGRLYLTNYEDIKDIQRLEDIFGIDDISLARIHS